MLTSGIIQIKSPLMEDSLRKVHVDSQVQEDELGDKR